MYLIPLIFFSLHGNIVNAVYSDFLIMLYT